MSTSGPPPRQHVDELLLRRPATKSVSVHSLDAEERFSDLLKVVTPK